MSRTGSIPAAAHSGIKPLVQVTTKLLGSSPELKALSLRGTAGLWLCRHTCLHSSKAYNSRLACPADGAGVMRLVNAPPVLRSAATGVLKPLRLRMGYITICRSSCHGRPHEPVAPPTLRTTHAHASGRRRALRYPHPLTRENRPAWLMRAPFFHTARQGRGGRTAGKGDGQRMTPHARGSRRARLVRTLVRPAGLSAAGGHAAARTRPQRQCLQRSARRRVLPGGGQARQMRFQLPALGRVARDQGQGLLHRLDRTGMVAGAVIDQG